MRLTNEHQPRPDEDGWWLKPQHFRVFVVGEFDPEFGIGICPEN
jgi:hypothetical protein